MSTSQNTSSKHNKGRTYTIKTTTHTGYSKYARSLLFSSSFAFVNARRGVKKLEMFCGKFIAFLTTVFDLLFDAIALRRTFCFFHVLAKSSALFSPLFAREAKTLLRIVVVIVVITGRCFKVLLMK